MKNIKMEQVSTHHWNEEINKFTNSHFLMSEEWIEIKQKVGWQPIPLLWRNDKDLSEACALVLERKVSLGPIKLPLSIHYIPKGPLLDWQNPELVNQVLGDIEKFAKQKKAIFVKIDPDVIDGKILSSTENIEEIQSGLEIKMLLKRRNWGFASDQIQFKNTVWIDLTKSTDQIMADMKQKTRYNIRLAQKKGVNIRVAKESELPLVYKIYAETAIRDNFTIRNADYYLTVWKKFMDHHLCDVLVAEIEGKIVAGLVLFYFGNKAYYVYGMSTNDYRNFMPTYLIQWEAILKAKENGKEIYDLWGAPEILNEQDSMWGVYRFKRGLGGDFISTIGAWDFVLNPFLMQIYQKIIPAFLNILRKFALRSTKQSVMSD